MNRKSIFTLGSLALAIATASTSIQSAELEEIIVTAQKRAENLQDVPISMTALDGERMEEAGIASFSDLSGYVPNLEIAENAVNTIITMRGISVGSNQSFEQSVGIYVDGIHYGKSRQVRTGLFDLEQVEVLRGPQGILFGKNTLAGAINVTSAEPNVGEEMKGTLSLSQESHDGQILEGNINASLTDNFAVRFAFKDREADGYMDNGDETSANTTMPTTDETIWRLTSIWEPNEDTSVKFKHTESDYVRLGGAATVTTFQPVANLELTDSLLYGVMGNVYPSFATDVASGVIQPNRDSVSFGGCALSAKMDPSSSCAAGSEKPEGTDTQTYDTSLNVEIDLDGGYTFTSVTGIAGYEYEDGIDADFLPIHFIGRSDISEYDQKSQEFRIASPVDQDFSFVAGTYFTSSEQEIDRLVAIDGTLGLPALTMQAITGLGNPAEGTSSGLAFSRTDLAGAYVLSLSPAEIQGQMQALGVTSVPELIGIIAQSPSITAQRGIEGATMFDQVGRISNWKQETDSWAVFLQGTYQLRDDLSLTAGLRYTEEDKKAHADMALTYAGANGYAGLATPSDNAGLALLMGNLFDSWAHNFNEERSTDQLTPAANLQWDMSDDHKYYLSYAEGFKSGGFNAVDDQNPAFDATTGLPKPTEPGVGFEYEDETASSWEIGGKHTLMDGAMSLNWAYFDSEYVDQQVSTFVGVGFVVTNAASSDVSGLEVDLAWQASEQLRLGASLALLDGKYNKFDSAACTALQESEILGGATSSGNCTAYATGSSQNISGGQLGADYSGSITADYEHPLSNGMMWFTSADFYFSDNWFLAGDLDPLDQQEAFQRTNIRTGIRAEDWDLMLYGRNITDETVAVGAADVPLAGGSHFKYLSPGEVWGAKFSYRF
jgi:iron complex outermembrane receptor protein